MAQRSSRSKKTKKQPQLRTGGGRSAKAKRAAARDASATRAAERGNPVKVRPAGAAGFTFVLLFAWCAVALITFAAYQLDRWYTTTTPDSLWLITAFAVVAVAPAVGGVSRTRADADSWGAQALLVPLGMFIAETILGPTCPTGGDCTALGARGEFGLFPSIVVIVGLAAAAWGLARWMFSRSESRRPAKGRVSYAIASSAIALGLIVFALPLAASLIGLDSVVRSGPKLAQQAAGDVANYCFDLGDSPNLAVRAAPSAIYGGWTVFAVSRTNENRPAVGGGRLPANWARTSTPSPYEALVAYNGDGDLVSVNCRRVAPASGNATKDDLTENAPTSNPLDPKTMGPGFVPEFLSKVLPPGATP